MMSDIQASIDMDRLLDKTERKRSKDPNVGVPLAQIIKRYAGYGTNAEENPHLYTDQNTKFGGRSRYGRGHVLPSDPEWAYSEYNDVTPPHEGTHAKYNAHVARKHNLPYGSEELQQKIHEGLNKFPKGLQQRVRQLLKDPIFWTVYTDSPMYVSPDSQPAYWNYATSGAEVPARLNAIEARLPKGTMLEKTSYGAKLFPTTKDLEDYLAYVNPDGYLINNPTFTPLENGVLSKLKRMLKR